MSYALLWIEVLIVSLLWIATLTSLAAHVVSKWPRRLVNAAGFLPPFLLLGGLTAVGGFLKFSVGYLSSWFWYSSSLLAAFIVGTVIIRYRASRKDDAAMVVAALTWPRSRLSAALLTAAVLATMTLWNMDLEARNRASALRIQAGTMLLAVVPPPVPDSQNAAIDYVKAFELLGKDSNVTSLDSPLSADTPDFHDPATLALLEHNERALSLMRQGSTLPECRFDHDYAHPSISMLLPELNRSRLAARLLRLHARRELSQGHVSAAIADANTIFRLGRDFGREPLLIGNLVSLAVDAIAVDLLQEILPKITDKNDLNTLRPGDAESLGRAFHRALQGEEAFGLSCFSDIASGELELSQITDASNGNNVIHVWSPPIGLFIRVFIFADDINAYRQLMAEYQQAATMPYPQGRGKVAQAEKNLRPQGAPLTALIGPALSNAFAVAARAQASHSSAIVAIAMARYRLDHAALPDKIESLIPAYLEEVPADPFDGNPLRMSNKNGDVTIYSIGPDLHDDGGAPYDGRKKTGDITFQLNTRQPTPETKPSR